MSIWYAHYPGDYGRDTAHLTLAQHGAYRLLLDHCYSTASPLPAELTSLYRICRAFDQKERDAVDSVLRAFFVLQEDGYHNSRADREIAKQAEIHERQSRAGKRTAAKRWAAGSSATSSPDYIETSSKTTNPQSHPQSQSSVTPIKERRAVLGGDD